MHRPVGGELPVVNLCVRTNVLDHDVQRAVEPGRVRRGHDLVLVGPDAQPLRPGYRFAAGVEAKTAAQGLLDQKADVILSVGGPIYQSAAEAIKDQNTGSVMIGVDADVFNTDPTVQGILLTSVMKGVDKGVKAVVEDAAGGDFNNTPFVGTLKNGGVGLAPFHNFASKVDPGLQKEIDAIKAKIISGDIKVTSAATPK